MDSHVRSSFARSVDEASEEDIRSSISFLLVTLIVPHKESDNQEFLFHGESVSIGNLEGGPQMSHITTMIFVLVPRLATRYWKCRSGKVDS
jgi:hypothetical protein